VAARGERPPGWGTSDAQELVLPPDSRVVAALAPAYSSPEPGDVKLVKAADGRRTLTVRDSRHEYVFTELVR
jgi:hypothetical protein